MNSTEKKLDALIDALGFDVEAITTKKFDGNYLGSDVYLYGVDSYKLTKRVEIKGPVDFEINKNNESLLLEKLKTVEVQIPILVKAVYENGFRDARKEDYLGCDVLAMWESSESKEELGK